MVVKRKVEIYLGQKVKLKVENAMGAVKLDILLKTVMLRKTNKKKMFTMRQMLLLLLMNAVKSMCY